MRNRQKLCQIKINVKLQAKCDVMYCQLPVADPEICPRGGWAMTRETCGPRQRPSFFD